MEGHVRILLAALVLQEAGVHWFEAHTLEAATATLFDDQTDVGNLDRFDANAPSDGRWGYNDLYGISGLMGGYRLLRSQDEIHPSRLTYDWRPRDVTLPLWGLDSYSRYLALGPENLEDTFAPEDVVQRMEPGILRGLRL